MSKPNRQDGDGLLDALKAIASECQRWRDEQPTTDGASKGWALHLQGIAESAIAAPPTRDGAELAGVQSGAGEREAVWTVRRCIDSPSSAPADQDYPAENYWDVLMPDGTWGGCVAVDANDARETMQKSWAEDHPETSRQAPHSSSETGS